MTTELTTKPEAPATLRSVLTGDAMREQFASVLPSHLSARRFVRVALTALTRTPALTKCTQASFFRCLLDLSALGIEPDGRRAHLIPFENKKLGVTECTLIIDYKGLAELAMRSGIIARIHSDVVCENDAFEYNIGRIVRHEVNFREPRGNMFAAYAIAETKDGASFCQVLTKEEIDGIRARSRAGSGPWVSDYQEMAKKTAFRRLSKWLPLSAEFRDAVDADDTITEKNITPLSASALFAPAAPALADSSEAEGGSE